MTNTNDPFYVFNTPESSSDSSIVLQGIRPKTSELSPYTLQMQNLQTRIPVVSDKALIDLVNGIQVSGEVVRYRKSRNFFGRLMDTLTGSERERELLVQGNLIGGQATLHQWILELSESLNISRVGLEVTQKSLEVTQKSLLEARNAIRNQRKSIEELRELILSVSKDLGDRIRKLEVRVSANEDLERIINAWAADRTYVGLPWAVQVALLAREVFSSSVALYELGSTDTQFRQRLIDKLVVESRYRETPSRFNGLGDVADIMWKEMQNNADCDLSTSLLETYSVQSQQLMNMPHLFVLGRTLELAMLQSEARPSSPGQCAVALCQAQIGDVSHISSPTDFITVIVEETANHCSALIGNSKSRKS
jgi:hypothetical protein